VRSEPVRPTLEVPLHVTAFWKPLWRRSPIASGSLGAGVLLRPGAVCWPSERPWPPVPPALAVGRVECKLPVPVGKGFATSAAITLAASLFSSKNFFEAVARAHASEVLHKTGLGDVMAIAFGREIAVRTRAGGPGWGRVESVEVPRGVSVIAFEVRSPFSDTPSMLSSLKVSDAFERAWRVLEKGFDFWSFLEAAELFSKSVGFLKLLDPKALRARGVLGGYVKKSVAVLFVDGKELEESLTEIRKIYKNAKVFSVCRGEVLRPCPLRRRPSIFRLTA